MSYFMRAVVFVSICLVAVGNGLVYAANNGVDFSKVLRSKQPTLAVLEQFIRYKFNLRLEGSKTRKSAYLHSRKIFGVPAEEIVIVSNPQGIVTQIDIIFANKGDSSNEKHLRRTLKDTAKTLEANLTKILGAPSRGKFGNGELEADALVWSDKIAKFYLEFNKNEYVILHICYNSKDSSDNKKTAVLSLKDLPKNIKRAANGDVFIDNIPMVNQGAKGYCVVASMERLLRYYGITSLTQHQLADLAKTTEEGTSMDRLISGTRDFRREMNLELIQCGEVNVKTIKKYTDLGIPLLWRMKPNAEFSRFLSMSRKSRNSFDSPKSWLKSVKNYKIPSQGGSHVCMIVGYNEETEEIAISNSYGDNEITPAWVPIKFAKKVSQGFLFTFAPKR